MIPGSAPPFAATFAREGSRVRAAAEAASQGPRHQLLAEPAPAYTLGGSPALLASVPPAPPPPRRRAPPPPPPIPASDVLAGPLPSPSWQPPLLQVSLPPEMIRTEPSAASILPVCTRAEGLRERAAVEVAEVLRMHDHNLEVKSNDVCGQGPSADNCTPAARDHHGTLGLSSERSVEQISDGGTAFMGRPAALPPPPPRPLSLFVELPFLHARLA